MPAAAICSSTTRCGPISVRRRSCRRRASAATVPTACSRSMRGSSTTRSPIAPPTWSSPPMSAAAISAPPGFLPAATSPSPKPCSPAPITTAISWNMIPTAPAASSRCASCRGATRSWWSASSPRNSASSRKRTTSSAGCRRRRNSCPWNSWPSRRNAASPRRRRATSSPKKNSGRNCGWRSRSRTRCGGGRCGVARAHKRARSDRLELAIGKPDHPQQQPAVAESGYLGLAEGTRLVVDRGFDDLQVLLGGAEDQIEIAEWIEIAEIAALPRQHLVVLAQQHLGAAKGICHPGVDEIAEQISEAAVGDEVEWPHRLVFHGINQAGAVHEFRFSGFDHGVIFRQGFRRHRQVGVEDHQDVAGRRRKALANGIALALAVLLQNLDVPAFFIGLANAFAFLECIVTGISLDEDDFLMRREARHPQDRVLDIAALVTAGDDDARRIFAVGELPHRAADQIGSQA